MMNFWNAWKVWFDSEVCQKVAPYIQTLNNHMADDVHEIGLIADTFTPFDNNICAYTWMCADPNNPDPNNPYPDKRPNPHATPAGHQAIANAFAAVMGLHPNK